ncbi:non-specific lipid transfer protein GPI-anchored 5-like, partial [Ziziphus jujuba]|uniref:Non-specific lipid transfer protein GPI-anchored 5-like n=1 Tax=Ziziphus jujuba TaxID=326968 RepID=A0A6P4AA01_ZIZJJ
EIVLIALIALLALWQGTLAQSDCGNAIIGMSSCLNYITGNTSSACCSQLATVMLSQPQCLCQVLNGGASSLGVNVNQTQALALPDACNVKTPSASRCNGSYPSDSPLGTGKTSKIGDSSDGNSTKLALSMLFFLLFVASFASASNAF